MHRMQAYLSFFLLHAKISLNINFATSGHPARELCMQCLRLPAVLPGKTNCNEALSAAAYAILVRV